MLPRRTPWCWKEGEGDCKNLSIWWTHQIIVLMSKQQTGEGELIRCAPMMVPLQVECLCQFMHTARHRILDSLDVTSWLHQSCNHAWWCNGKTVVFVWQKLYRENPIAQINTRMQWKILYTCTSTWIYTEYDMRDIWIYWIETNGSIYRSYMKLLWQLLLCLYLILDPSSNFHQRTCHRMPGQGLEDASASQARQERQQKCLEAQGNHHDFKRLAGLAYLTWDNACMCAWLRFDGTSCIYIHTSAKRLGSW